MHTDYALVVAVVEQADVVVVADNGNVAVLTFGHNEAPENESVVMAVAF